MVPLDYVLSLFVLCFVFLEYFLDKKKSVFIILVVELQPLYTHLENNNNFQQKCSFVEVQLHTEMHDNSVDWGLIKSVPSVECPKAV